MINRGGRVRRTVAVSSLLVRLFFRGAPLAFGLFALHCSGQDDDDEQSPLDVCRGTYECVLVRGGPYNSAELTLSRRADGCYAGDLNLEGRGRTVRGNTESFRACDDSGCMDCTLTERPTTTGARCTGSATSCSSVGASSCAWQSGCQYLVGATASTSDDDCGGTANDCDEMSSKDQCEAQRGCAWR